MLLAQLIVLLFAIGLLYFCAKMMVNPVKFASGMRQFADWKFFHPFEVGTRFLFALGFYFSYQSNAFPRLYLFLAGLLTFTTIFLIIIGKRRHQRFAYQAAAKSAPYLRPSAIVGIIFAAFIIYTQIPQ